MWVTNPQELLLNASFCFPATDNYRSFTPARPDEQTLSLTLTNTTQQKILCLLLTTETVCWCFFTKQNKQTQIFL